MFILLLFLFFFISLSFSSASYFVVVFLCNMVPLISGALVSAHNMASILIIGIRWIKKVESAEKHLPLHLVSPDFHYSLLRHFLASSFRAFLLCFYAV